MTTAKPYVCSPTRLTTSRHEGAYRVYFGSHLIGIVGNLDQDADDNQAHKMPWYAHAPDEAPIRYFATRSRAVRFLASQAVDGDPNAWCYFGQNWESHCERLDQERDQVRVIKPEPPTVTVPVMTAVQVAKVLSAHAWSEYEVDMDTAAADLHLQDTAGSDLEDLQSIAVLIAQGKTTAAWDDLTKMDTVVRDGIPRDVWIWIVNSLAVI